MPILFPDVACCGMKHLTHLGISRSEMSTLAQKVKGPKENKGAQGLTDQRLPHLPQSVLFFTFSGKIGWWNSIHRREGSFDWGLGESKGPVDLGS